MFATTRSFPVRYVSGMDTKVITLRRGFLGTREARRQQKLIERMAKKGYRYVDTVKGWGGYRLTFQKETGPSR